MSEGGLAAKLREIEYFGLVSEPCLERLAQGARRRSFAAGEGLFFEGEESAGLWVLEEGLVKAFKLSRDGREYVLRIFGPGETMNDLAALDGEPNVASAMGVAAGVAWVIPSSVFLAALEEDRELALAVIRGLVGRVRALVGRVEDLALRPVTGRLARYLLEQVENEGAAEGQVTRALIASTLATTPESVSRSLRALEEAGGIRFDRHRIVIVRPEVLREAAAL